MRLVFSEIDHEIIISVSWLDFDAAAHNIRPLLFAVAWALGRLGALHALACKLANAVFSIFTPTKV